MEPTLSDSFDLENYETNEAWEDAKFVVKGSSCYILLARERSTQKLEIIKLFKENVKAVTAKTEADLMMSLSHPRIIGTLRYLTEVPISKREFLRPMTTSALVLEYAPEGDLLQMIQKHRGLPEVVARTYFHQIIDAVEYLHNSQICHLDIKPENVLLDKKFCAKLTDFGYAQKVPEDGLLSKVIGTKPYLSPEMHKRLEYSAYKSDLFALGLTLFTMVSGMMPFSVAREDDELYSMIKEGEYQEFWSFHEGVKRSSKSTYYSAALKNLLNSMLAYKPGSRLDLRQIREHVWFKGEVLTDDELEAFLRGPMTK